MTPLFVGQTDQIQEQAQRLDWDISGFEIINIDRTADIARTTVYAVLNGKADAIMKGHLHTDMFMKAVINREAGLRTQNRLVHVFHITAPHNEKPLLISDAAVNVMPDLETRKASIRAVVEIAQAVGIETPKIALLSATEEPIPSVPSAVEARELANWASESLPSAEVSGPLALDVILSKEAARIKRLDDNPVAGSADAIVVPDLVSGNTLFKSLVYLAGGCAGGVVMGGRVPILLTSRADPPEARLASAALAAILCGSKKNKSE